MDSSPKSTTAPPLPPRLWEAARTAAPAKNQGNFEQKIEEEGEEMQREQQSIVRATPPPLPPRGESPRLLSPSSALAFSFSGGAAEAGGRGGLCSSPAVLQVDSEAPVEVVMGSSMTTTGEHVQSHTSIRAAAATAAVEEDDIKDRDFELVQQMLSPQGLRIKKVLPEGIAYPVRLRLLMRQDRDVVDDDYLLQNMNQVPQPDMSVSLSLTWLDEDETGLDLCGLIAVRPLHTTTAAAAPAAAAVEKYQSENCSSSSSGSDEEGGVERRSDGTLTSREAEGHLYNKLLAARARGRGARIRNDSRLLLLLAWEELLQDERSPRQPDSQQQQQQQQQQDSCGSGAQGDTVANRAVPAAAPAIAADIGVDSAAAGTSTTLLQLEASSQSQRDSLVRCLQQLVSEVRAQVWEDQEGVAVPDRDNSEEGTASAAEAVGTDAEPKVSRSSGDGDSAAGKLGRLEAREVEVLTQPPKKNTSPAPAEGSECGATENYVGVGAAAGCSTITGDSVGGSADSAGSCRNDDDEDREENKEVGGQVQEKEDGDVLGLGLVLNRPLPRIHHDEQEQQGTPRSRPPLPLAPKRERDLNTATTSNRISRALGLPPRGTQRYWSVRDLSSKSVLLRRRRSAGVRTPSGQYIGGNVVRGTSLQSRGQRRKSMLQSSGSFFSLSRGDSLMMDGSSGSGLATAAAATAAADALERCKKVSTRVLWLYDRWHDEARVAAWTIAVMKVQTILSKSVARETQRRWETWCAAVRRSNRANMLSDRRQWFLHAVANEGNDLQAWYQSTFHREVYRIKGPFWYKYTGLEKFDKAYRKTPDRPLTELERRMIYSCVSSSGTRYSDIAFHDFTAQAVLTREEMRLFWNLMERDVAVPKAAPEPGMKSGKRTSQPRALRLLFYKGRLDLMWEGKPDRFGNTTAHDNFSRIAQMHLRPTHHTTTTTTTMSSSSSTSAAGSPVAMTNLGKFRDNVSRPNSVFSSNQSNSSSTSTASNHSNSDQEGSKHTSYVSPKQNNSSSSTNTIATPTINPSLAPTLTLVGQGSPDSTTSPTNQQQGRGIAGLAAKRRASSMDGGTTAASTMPTVPTEEKRSNSARAEEQVELGGEGERARGERGRGEGRGSGSCGESQEGSGHQQGGGGGVAGRERDKEGGGGKGEGRGEERVVVNGYMLSVYFLGATGTLDLWFPTEKQGKTWQGMLKKLAAKEKGYMYDYRKVKSHRSAGSGLGSSGGSASRSKPSPVSDAGASHRGRQANGFPGTSDTTATNAQQLSSDNDPPNPRPTASSQHQRGAASDSADPTVQSGGTIRSSPTTTPSDQNKHGAGRCGNRGDDYPADPDITATTTTIPRRGDDGNISPRRGNVGGERRNNVTAAGGGSPRASPSGSSSESSGGGGGGGWEGEQEYRIDGLITRRQEVSAGGLCSAR